MFTSVSVSRFLNSAWHIKEVNKYLIGGVDGQRGTDKYYLGGKSGP